jgi:long-chain fatty acid transport protein
MKRTFLILALVLWNGWLFSAGFALYEHSARATGMAGAFTATASDPGALFYNPAGIAFQERSFYLETTGIMPSSKFEGAGAYPGEGYHAQMSDQYFFPSNLSFVLPLAPRWTVAAGMFNPFGLGTKWENPSEFAGRFLSTKAEIEGYNLAAAAAYKPTDNLAFSLGVHYLAAKLALQKYVGKINPYTQTVANIGFVDLESDLDGGFGCDIGILYKFGGSWSAGLAYHSKTKVEFGGTAEMTQVMTGYTDFDAAVGAQFPAGDHDVTTAIEFPAMTFVGLSKQVTDALRMEINIGYNEWTSFDALSIEFVDDPALSTTQVEDWEDTWTFRLGAEYALGQDRFLRAGYVYDHTPQPTWNMSPMLGDADRTGIALGYGAIMGSSMTLDAGYMYLMFKDRSTHGEQQDGYDGTYKNTAHLLGLSLRYQF